MPSHIRSLTTPAGIYNLFHGFGLIISLSGIGYAVNRKKGLGNIPRPIAYIIPLSVFFALLSGNMGRMLFSAYLPIIAYSLISLAILMNAKTISFIRFNAEGRKDSFKISDAKQPGWS